MSRPSKIMIIGTEGEPHANHIFTELLRRGYDAFYFDSSTFPKQTKLNLTVSNADLHTASTLVLPDGRAIGIIDIQSVYWRYNFPVSGDKIRNKINRFFIPREIKSALGSLYRNIPHAKWVNPSPAGLLHRFKPHHLLLAAQAGVRIPDTLVSNDGDAVTAFYEKHQGQVIYKPVNGGALTQKLEPADLKKSRLKGLSTSPVQFQEMIPGVDVRIYVVGDRIFAAEIQAGTLDFREDGNAPVQPLTLPDLISEQCLRLTRLYDYVFTGIDMRRTPQGEYVFFEANSSPMFIYFEQMTGYPITDSLIAELTRV